MSYERYHILDFCIEDEQLTNNDREVSVFVDTLGMTSIEFGNSMTVRTDYNGVADLRDALHSALCKLDVISSYNRTNEAMNKMTEDMNPVTPMQSALSAPNLSSQRSEQQKVDPFSPVLSNDPLKW